MIPFHPNHSVSLETWKGTLKNDLALAVGLGIEWDIP